MSSFVDSDPLNSADYDPFSLSVHSPVPASPSPDFDISSPFPAEPLCLPAPPPPTNDVQPPPPAEPATQQAKRSVTEPEPEPETKRQRGRRELTEEQRRKARFRRAELNRHFARVHRQRQKQYIIQLETRIEVLGAELAECKRRLAGYEAAANRNVYTNFEEFYRRVKADVKCFSGRLTLQFASSLQTHNAAPVMEATMAERSRALSLMADTMVDMSMPPTARYITALADEVESNSTRVDPGEEEELGEPGRMKRDAKKLLLEWPEARKSLQGFAVRLRKDVGGYFRSLENMNRLELDLNRYMVEQLVPMIGQSSVGRMADWIRFFVVSSQPSLAMVPRVIRGETDYARGERPAVEPVA